MSTAYPEDYPSYLSPEGPESNTWISHRGKTGLTVYTHAGGYATKLAESELRHLERFAAALKQLVLPRIAVQRGAFAGSATGATRFALYLVDHFEDADFTTHETSGTDQIVRVVKLAQKNSDPLPACIILGRILLADWFGLPVTSEQLLVDGLSGLAAARVGLGSLVEAEARVRTALAQGHSVLGLTVRPQGAASSVQHNVSEDATGQMAAAICFIVYLINIYGSDALQEFVAIHNPARPDEAAEAVFHRPLIALKSAWMAEMRQTEGARDALKSFVRRIMPLLRPYRWQQAEILVYMGFNAACTLATPFAAGYLIDRLRIYFSLSPRPDPTAFGIELLFKFFVILLVIYIANGLVAVRQSYASSWLAQRIQRELQEQLFTHLQRLSHNFYANSRVGDLMARLTGDLPIVTQALTQILTIGIYQALIMLAAAITILIKTYQAHVPWLGVLMLGTLPLFTISFIVLRNRSKKLALDQQKRVGDTATFLQENLSAQPLIKALGLEKSTIDGYHERLQIQQNASLRLVLLNGLSSLSVTLTVGIGQLIVLSVGGWYVLHDPQHMTIGTLTVLSALLPQVTYPISNLASMGQGLQMALGALDRVNQILNEPVDVADQPDARPLPPLLSEIRIEKVSFGYGGELVLRDLDLTVHAGECVALIGPSGCGKSTTINLLMRFYDPLEGRVLFDGNDLSHITLESLRRQTSLVFQETFIFDTTVRENIKISRPDATEEEIVAAAKAALLHDWVISLPNSYDTLLGEKGSAMSGGQRQRLSIARALLRDPRLLLLDEATSALDPKTEAGVLETLSTLAKGRTTIMITHRMAMATIANRVIVLDKGRIVEQGTPDQLRVAGGIFQSLYEEQLGAAALTPFIADLRTIPFFITLGDDALDALAACLIPHLYKAGEVILSEGDTSNDLYLIDTGAVEILSSDGGSTGDSNAKMTLRRIAILEKGEYFGEAALLTGTARTATVRTTEPTRLFSLSRPDFMEVAERYPEIKSTAEDMMKARLAALKSITRVPIST